MARDTINKIKRQVTNSLLKCNGLYVRKRMYAKYNFIVILITSK